MSPPSLRFLTFWSINGTMNRDRCRDQLKRMRELGFDGAVFHPRFYPGRPPYLGPEYMEVLSGVVLDARELGMAIWIYDEDGWPSGTVGGEMLRRHPGLRQQWVGLYREAPGEGEVLTTFDRDGQRWLAVRRDGVGVDYLNRELAARFLELTHDRYRLGLSAEAFAHVEAFFCDEPEFGLGHAYADLPMDGAIPWSADFPARFAEQGGGDLLRKLPGLFFRSEGPAEDRVRFWEFLADEFCEGFLTPMNRWCGEHGKRFTAHIKGEEHPLFQLPMVGSCSGVFRRIALPGIDALERFPGNDFFPRQCSATARQFGDGRCMAEVFGGAGWGAGPGDFERFVNWLAGHGLTDFVVHLWQYELSSSAIRDWPASLPVHQNWRDAFPEVLRRVKQRRATSPVVSPDTLVVTPHRGIMAEYEPWELLQTNVHNAASYPSTPAGGINDAFLRRVIELKGRGDTCDFVDESTFERDAVREENGWRVGAVRYERVVVATGARLGASSCDSIAAESIADLRTAQNLPPPESSEIWNEVALRWQPVVPPRNGLLLDVREAGEGRWCAQIDVRQPLAEPLDLEFADPVAELTLNGVGLEATRSNKGERAAVARLEVGTTPFAHELRFRSVGTTKSPFVWLRGQFAVESRSEWRVVRENTLFTEGPLFLARPAAVLPPETEWVSAGYGQLTEPLSASGVFELQMETDVLRWMGGSGDAAHVWIDGEDCGWMWGPEWRVTARSGRTWATGRHSLRIEWVGSTYNVYGPHHYFAGDRHVISPDQFAGRLNFADPADAPKHTLVAGWHFRMLRLPTTMNAIAKNMR